MAVYECICGFTSPSATTFHRHLTRFKGEEMGHYMVPIGEPEHRRARQATELEAQAVGVATPKLPTPPSLEESESSPSLPVSRRRGVNGNISGLTMSTQPSAKLEGNYINGGTPDSLASGEADAAWEAIGNEVSESEDGYAELTRQLEAAVSQPEPSGEWGIAEAFTRTVGRLRSSWIGSPPSQSLSARPTADELVAAAECISADSVESLLVWEEPWLTAKVYIGGLYFLICLRQLVHGVEILQPSTAITGLLLAGLMYKMATKLVRFYLHYFPGWTRDWLVTWVSGVSDREGMTQAAKEERIMAVTKDLLLAGGRLAAPALGAVAACIARRLRGDKVAPSIWLALTLWSVMCLGEVGLLSQSALVIVLWTALFVLPPLYCTSQQALDALVDEAIGFLMAVVDGGEKGTLILAAASGLTVGVALDVSFLLRASLAGLTCGGVLLWRARRLAAEEQTSEA